MTVSISILVDGAHLKGWQFQAIRALQNTEAVTTRIDSFIIRKERSESDRTSLLPPIVRTNPAFASMIAYGRFRDRLLGERWYREKYHIRELPGFENAEVFECKAVPGSGMGNQLPDDAIDLLAESDVGVRYGFGILVGDALDAPTYGVLSYHHGDLRQYRGRPAGFYEFLHDKQVAGVTLQLLTEDLDAGDVVEIRQVDIADTKSWSQVKNRLFSASTSMLADNIEKITAGEQSVRIDCQGKLYTIPVFKDVMKYILKSSRRRIPF